MAVPRGRAGPYRVAADPAAHPPADRDDLRVQPLHSPSRRPLRRPRRHGHCPRPLPERPGTISRPLVSRQPRLKFLDPVRILAEGWRVTAEPAATLPRYGSRRAAVG